MFKAHRLVYHSTLGLRVIKRKKKVQCVGRLLLRVLTPLILPIGLLSLSLLLSSPELSDTEVYAP